MDNSIERKVYIVQLDYVVSATSEKEAIYQVINAIEDGKQANLVIAERAKKIITKNRKGEWQIMLTEDLKNILENEEEENVK